MRLIDADALMTSLKIPNTDCEGCESADPNYGSCMRDFAEACTAIKDAPTIEEPHWILCSERLPEKETDLDFLVTDGESMAVGYYRWDAKAWDSVDFGWIENREDGYGINEVIAWMPLPEPYGK